MKKANRFKVLKESIDEKGASTEHRQQAQMLLIRESYIKFNG